MTIFSLKPTGRSGWSRSRPKVARISRPFVPWSRRPGGPECQVGGLWLADLCGVAGLDARARGRCPRTWAVPSAGKAAPGPGCVARSAGIVMALRTAGETRIDTSRRAGGARVDWLAHLFMQFPPKYYNAYRIISLDVRIILKYVHLFIF